MNEASNSRSEYFSLSQEVQGRIKQILPYSSNGITPSRIRAMIYEPVKRITSQLEELNNEINKSLEEAFQQGRCLKISGLHQEDLYIPIT